MKKLAVILLLMISTHVHGAEVAYSGTLKAVYPLGDGSFAILFTQSTVSCPNSSPQYFHVVTGQNGVVAEGLKNMLAAAFVGLTTGTVVTIAFDDATVNCYVNRMNVSQP